MLEPRKIESNTKPRTFECLGNGKWYYNYNIQLYTVDIDDENDNGIRYSFTPILMQGKPDYNRCVEYVIREHITQSQEFDLINSYNRISLNILPEDSVQKCTSEYMEYLNKVAEIKVNIKKDFN